MTDEIRVRRDTTDGWTALNPVPAEGEITHDKTRLTFRIGDGVTPWVDLPEVGGVKVFDYSESNTQVSLSASGTIWTRTLTAARAGTYLGLATYWSWGGGGYGDISFRKNGAQIGGRSDPGRQAQPAERSIFAFIPHTGGDLVLDLYFAREAGTIQFGTSGDSRFGRHVHVLGPL